MSDLNDWAAIFATEAERVQALKVAADVLRVRQPCSQTLCMVRIGPNVLDAHASWTWPGVVRVTLRYTGGLIAQSEPGRPYSLARIKWGRHA